MSRRTVLHLIHTPGSGGAETLMNQLIGHLDPERWRSVAVVPGEGWLLSTLREEGIAEVVVQPVSGSFDLRMVRRLIGLARAHRVDLIQTHLFGPAVYGSLVGRLLGLPVVATIHGAVDLSVANKWWGLKKLIVRGKRTHFVAVTESLHQVLLDELGTPPERTRVILNGVDIDRFAPARTRRLREQWGWTDGEVVIGAVGNIRHPKGYPILLQAAAQLRQRSPRYRFVIVGDTAGEPALYRELMEMRDSLQLQDTVSFLGFRSDVEKILNELDLYVMSSTREGLPLAILQAMAAKLPIVATRCGGPQEVLTHERDAVLVDVGDPTALADGIQWMVEHREEAQRLAAAAYETVQTRFALERMARNYEDLYRECLASDAVRA